MKSLKKNIAVLYLAMKDKRTSILVKILALLVISYALSPIDLIPDFIPVFGLLDDLILLPLGIYLIYKLIPLNIKNELEIKAEGLLLKKRFNVVSVIIIFVWISCTVILIFALTHFLTPRGT